jgi:hypothetical protein
MHSHTSPTRRSGLSGGLLLAILALAVPPLVAAADVTVSAIPGGGWAQSPENTGSLAAAIVASPAAGLGDDSVELATEAATTDLVGIVRAVVQPLSDVTGGSWQTYVNGDSGNIASASLRVALLDAPNASR